MNHAAVAVGVCHVTIILERCEQLFSHLDRELRSQNKDTTKVQRGELKNFIGAIHRNMGERLLIDAQVIQRQQYHY